MSTTVRFTSTPIIHTPGIILWMRESFSKREVMKRVREYWPNAPEAAYAKLAVGDYAIADDGETVLVHLDSAVVDVEIAEHLGVAI